MLEQAKRRDDLAGAYRVDRRVLHEERVEEVCDAETLDLAGALAEQLLFVVCVGRRDDGPRVRLAHEVVAHRSRRGQEGRCGAADDDTVLLARRRVAVDAVVADMRDGFVVVRHVAVRLDDVALDGVRVRGHP